MYVKQNSFSAPGQVGKLRCSKALWLFFLNHILHKGTSQLKHYDSSDDHVFLMGNAHLPSDQEESQRMENSASSLLVQGPWEPLF